MGVKISELLKQETPTVNVGDYFVAHTREEGFVSTFKGPGKVHAGQYLFKVLEHGTGGRKLVPVVTSADGKEFVEKVNEPIIIQKDGKMWYVIGTTNSTDRHPYYEGDIREADIEEGDEVRSMAVAFKNFAHYEYSIGVFDLEVEEASVLEGDEPEEPEAP
jgi:hypothetical protein